MKYTDKIFKINKKFNIQGTINPTNMEYDFSEAENQKNVYRKCAHWIRGIVSGHPFVDGNKRTALNLVVKELNKNKIKCDKDSLIRLILNVAKKNVSINSIENKLRKICRR